jgi:hypothetical protein
MLADLLPVAAQGGLLAAVAGVFGLLHRSAVRAYREQTADWREAFALERAAHEETRRQLLHVLAPLAERAS